MAPASLSSGFQSFTAIPTIKLGHSGAGSRVSGPVHALGPCGSLTTSPVRLGVCPAAAPTPRGTFNQRFEALFPRAGALGCAVCFTSRRLSGLCVRECGVTGSASGRTACPFIPHSASLGPARATRVLSALVPISAPPTGLDECLFFISLVLSLIHI